MHLKTLNLDKDLLLLHVEGSNQTSYSTGVCQADIHKVHISKGFLKPFIPQKSVVIFSFFLMYLESFKTFNTPVSV